MVTAKKIIVAAGLLVFSSFVLAQGKVVVLDLQDAVLRTDLAQKQLEALEKNPDYAALRTKFESLTADLQSLQEDAEKNSMTWSEDQRKEKEEEAQTLRRDYEATVQTLQRGRQQVMQNVMQQMGERTRTVLDNLIEAEKIGLILNSQSAYHASPEYDITERVTDLLNKAQ